VCSTGTPEQKAHRSHPYQVGLPFTEKGEYSLSVPGLGLDEPSVLSRRTTNGRPVPPRRAACLVILRRKRSYLRLTRSANPDIPPNASTREGFFHHISRIRGRLALRRLRRTYFSAARNSTSSGNPEWLGCQAGLQVLEVTRMQPFFDANHFL